MRIFFRAIVLFMLLVINGSCKGQKKLLQNHLCTMMGALRPSASSIDSLVGEGNLLWKKQKVTVYFMDDDGNIRDQVLRIANFWQPFSGIQFIRSFSQSSSDIRVSFRTNGWWSYIGSNTGVVGKDSVTLSLGNLYLYPLPTIKSVILHEFGHSLGLLHEHQHPFLNINWNIPVLYQYYKDTFNVDSSWVKENILKKYITNTAIYCEPDHASIMIYAIPSGLTTDGLVIPEPLELSLLDKKYIQYMYTGKKCN